MEKANSAEQTVGAIDVAIDSIPTEIPFSSARRLLPTALFIVKLRHSRYCSETKTP